MNQVIKYLGMPVVSMKHSASVKFSYIEIGCDFHHFSSPEPKAHKVSL